MKTLLYISSMFVFFQTAFAQVETNTRTTSVDITGHYTQYGQAFSLGMNERFGAFNYKVKVNYESGKVKSYKYDSYNLIPSFAYSVINIKSKFIVNAEIGGLMAVEKVKNIEPQIYLNKTVFGGIGGIELVYALKDFSFLLNGYEFISSGSNLYSNHFQVGAGIRVNIN